MWKGREHASGARMAGKTFVFTGGLEGFTREEPPGSWRSVGAGVVEREQEDILCGVGRTPVPSSIDAELGVRVLSEEDLPN